MKDRLIVRTLCLTLVIATTGIVYLMATGVNVDKAVSLAVAAGWYKLVRKV